MMADTRKRWLAAALVVLSAGAGFLLWQKLAEDGLAAGFARGNGRIEAVEIDIATKAAGRIRDILVSEGDFVTAGQLLAQMDTRQLEAQRRQAEAQLKRAEIGIGTARSLVGQRQAERKAALAVVAQREAERSVTLKRLARTEELARADFASRQNLDNDRAAAEGASAALAAAQAQLAAVDAAIGAAEAQVVDAEAATDAARAAIESISTEIADSALIATRDGRVQYRVAEPGEVLSPGGRVLNLVDLGEVHMTFFLSTAQAGRVAIGSDVRIVLDAAPQYVIPATVSFVADVAQFTPKTVETEEERLKLMFRVKARVAPELLRKYIRQVKTGLPGMAYVRLSPDAEWPASLQGTLLQ